MQNKTAIVLVNWNGYQLTRDCIFSIYQSNSKEFDIIVVDNGSHDDSVSKLQFEFPEIIYLPQSSNLGFAGGNNKALEYVLAHQYEYVMMLNNDTLVDPNFLLHLVNYLDFHPEAGAVQPNIFFEDNRGVLWNGGSGFLKLLGLTYARNQQSSIHKKQPREVNWITGCAFMMRTSILRKVGLLNEKYFTYFEDVDLSFKIKKAGSILMLHPDSIVYHKVCSTSKSQTNAGEGMLHPSIHYYTTRNQIWLNRTWLEWYYWPTAMMYMTCRTISLMCYFTIRGRFKKCTAVCNGFIDGFLTNPY